MEWIAIGLGILLLLCWNNGRRKPKALTLEEARSRYPIDEAELDSDDPEVLSDLLSDLGTLVYFGAVMEVVQDRKRAAFPSLWSAQFNQGGVNHALGMMGALGHRLCKRIGEMPEVTQADENRKVLTSEVVSWAGMKVGIDMRREILESLRGAE